MFKGHKRHKTIKCRLGKLQQSFSNLAFTERSPGQLPDKILIYHQIDFNQLLLLNYQLLETVQSWTDRVNEKNELCSLLTRMNSGNFQIFDSTDSLQGIYRLLKSIKNDTKYAPIFRDISSKTQFKKMLGRSCGRIIIFYFSIHIHQKSKRNIWAHRLDLLYFKLIIGLLMLGDELFNQWLTNQIEPVSFWPFFGVWDVTKL